MGAPYNVLEICRYVVKYSEEKEYGVSHLKLQKLLYFIQAYFIIKKNAPCFKEKIEAWAFGPVVRKAYDAYCQFGATNIPHMPTYVEFDIHDIFGLKRLQYNDKNISNEDKNLINIVIDTFSNYGPSDLVTITHQQDPWKNAYSQGKNTEITINSMREYFCKQKKQ